MSTQADTIIALATPFTSSAIHILRISGPKSLAFLRHLGGLSEVLPRHVYTRPLRHEGRLLDRGVLFFFQGPASYTGEDMGEIHCHGSTSASAAILRAGLQFGLKPAGAGEFTRRAFLHGKLSLEQAEAVDALVRSRTDFTRENALRILERKASLRFHEVHETLLSLLSDLETSIEFPEDDDSTTLQDRRALYGRVKPRLLEIQAFLSRLARHYDRGRKLEEGVRVVILGTPNAGKSTLMNALLREERVLVSPEKGTTRDFVREPVALGGIPVLLFDTAGVRPDAGEVERRGIEKTKELLSSADLVIVLLHETECVAALSALPEFPPADRRQVYLSKSDTLSAEDLRALRSACHLAGWDVAEAVNLLLPADIEKMESQLAPLLAARFQPEMDAVALLNERQRRVAREILAAFEALVPRLDDGLGEELFAEELHTLRRLFSELDLDISREQILDHIFSKFCIGK